MKRKYTIRTTNEKTQILHEYEAISGPGSVMRRAELARKYGFPTMPALYSCVAYHRRWLEEHTQQPESNQLVMAEVATASGSTSPVEWATDWLLDVEATLGRDGLTTDMLLAHLARYSRR